MISVPGRKVYISSNLSHSPAHWHIPLLKSPLSPPPPPYSQNGRRVPPNFEVSVSNLEFSQTRYEWEFQRSRQNFHLRRNTQGEPFNFPLNIQFLIWSSCRCASPRCCCLTLFRPWYFGIIRLVPPSVSPLFVVQLPPNLV